MDFFIQTIAGFLVWLGLGSYHFSVQNFTFKAEAKPMVAFPQHLEPAKLTAIPYLLRGSPQFDGSAITAKSAIAMDEGTGRVLFAKDASLVRPIASLTKLMSVLVWFDIGGNLNQTVEISAADYREGSIPYFIAGDKVKTKDLLYAALVASSNSAVAALVRSTGLPEAGFVRLMNAKARELGMDNTHFFDPIGLSPQNESTATDLFILARESFSNPEISRATEASSYEFSPEGSGAVRILRSTDQLLAGSLNDKDYKIIGGKTGYIEESDYNLILKTYGREKEKNIITVVLGSNDKNARFSEAEKIIKWTYKNYMWKI